MNSIILFTDNYLWLFLITAVLCIAIFLFFGSKNFKTPFSQLDKFIASSFYLFFFILIFLSFIYIALPLCYFCSTFIFGIRHILYLLILVYYCTANNICIVLLVICPVFSVIKKNYSDKSIIEVLTSEDFYQQQIQPDTSSLIMVLNVLLKRRSTKEKSFFALIISYIMSFNLLVFLANVSNYEEIKQEIINNKTLINDV